MPRRRTTATWTFAITAIALFMVALDNLVVTTALPVIRADLGSSISDLEWMVNAYTLTFAVLLLTGAALGDRFGRRRVFVIGLVIFTVGSAAAALAPSSTALILARALQGVGGAIVTPLTLTILSAGVSAERRPLALGAWGGIGGLAIAIGPVVGGAIAQGVNWHWIFWLNVPVGIVAAILAYFRLEETTGPEGRLDIGGLALASAGLLGVVWAVIHGNERGWFDLQIIAGLGIGGALLLGFVAWELRTRSPMLPPHLFRNIGFTAANTASLLMYFGMFGSVFLLSQFFQVVQGMNPFEAGLRVLPWTAMPIFVAPIAGVLSGRIGARPDRRQRPGADVLRSRVAGGDRRARLPTTPPSSCRSSSAAPAWGCSLRRSPTSCCRPFDPRRKARRRVPTTPSARLAESSASRCWLPCSRPGARTSRRRRTSTGSFLPSGWARRSWLSPRSARSSFPAASAASS